MLELTRHARLQLPQYLHSELPSYLGMLQGGCRCNVTESEEGVTLPRVAPARLVRSRRWDGQRNLSVLLVSHTGMLDGAPRWLLMVARVLRARNHTVVVASLTDGPILERFRDEGCRTLVLASRPAGPRLVLTKLGPGALEQILEQAGGAPSYDLVVVNTVFFSPLTYYHDPLCVEMPRVVIELDASHSSAFLF